jgi:hypothetical protein
MLNEFARYIAKKQQPISMTYCTHFARLVIRGCGQPLYKMFHHNKMISELKNNMLNEKSVFLAIFTVATNKISITSDIWTACIHGLSYSYVTTQYIDHDWIL